MKVSTKEQAPRLAPPVILAAMLFLVALAFVLYLFLGSVNISFARVLEILFRHEDTSIEGTTIWVIRMPRACYALIVGASLGAVGSAFQALFRNPLADPYIVGVSGGAAVGGALALVTNVGAFAAGFGLPICATAGGLISLGCVVLLARRRNVLDIQTLLLAGVVMGSLLSAVLSLVLYWGNQDTNIILRWLLGSLSFADKSKAFLLAGITLVGIVILVLQSKRLNLFSMGEDTAQRLGVNTRRLKPLVLITGSTMVAVSVGIVGIIGFLGLVAPHIARRLLGVDWRWSLLGSALLGSILLLGADLLSQRAVASTEVPVGIVTAILGAPFLLVLMRRAG